MEKILKYWYIWAPLLVIGGFAIGKNWDTWFPATDDTIDPVTGERKKVGCRSLGGEDCCPPKSIKFDSEQNKNVCV